MTCIFTVLQKRENPLPAHAACRACAAAAGRVGKESGSQENGNNADIIKNDRKNEWLLAVDGSPHE